LSTLINSGQITREDALKEISTPTYPPDLMQQDYDYVLKKFCFTKEEFEEIMALKIKSHLDYPTDFNSKLSRKVYPSLYKFYPILRPIYKKLQKIFPFI
jgi:hypothetical protein